MMTIPTGAPPAGGFPVVVAAHGTGGSFTGPTLEGLAHEWATGDDGASTVRAATIAIDLPQHGARRGGSSRPPDRLVFNFANPRAARDVWYQGASDLLALVSFAMSFDLPAASSPTGERIAFDGSRIVLWGHSQGANHASLMVPFEPNVSAVLFSGLGGDLTESLLTKTEPVDIESIVPFAIADVDGGGNVAMGDYNPALAIVQAYYDRVDPVNFGRRIWREPRGPTDTGRHVFMTYGLGDRFSTERTMAAFAFSASFPIVEPVLAPLPLSMAPPPLFLNAGVSGTMRTIGMRQYAPPAGVDGHFVSTLSPEGRADAIRFVLDALGGAPPRIGM
jgi:hypothetical protein